jgi:hypothetical protein
MTQIHKRFGDSQVKDLISRYLRKEIGRKYVQEILGIKKARFFALVKQFRENPKDFSIQYPRETPTRKISGNIEENILKELDIDKKLIQDKSNPLTAYNYSYIRDRLKDDYKQIVSVPTIINRAKRNGFYLPKKLRKRSHDREVLTNYTGELIQHDSSHHKWSPYVTEKWYLITSLDDFSRYIFYAVLVEKETSWTHIQALEHVILKYGFPFSFYTDSHSIFRFVQGRDSFWRNHYKVTDEADPQWKQILIECNIKPINALSPQAKGKIERPYRWLQDRLVRTCAREDVVDIKHAQIILNSIIRKYNYQWVHSTTKEIPYIRLKKALKTNSLFREFKLPAPFVSTKDIFCLRVKRSIDAYRKVSLNNLKFNVNAMPSQPVTLRIYPLNKSVSEVRFWCKDKLVDVQRAKNSDLRISCF